MGVADKVNEHKMRYTVTPNKSVTLVAILLGDGMRGAYVLPMVQ